MRREMLCARAGAEQQQQLATSKRLGWGRRTLKLGRRVVNWGRSLLLKRRRWAVAILVTCPHIGGLGVLLAPGAPHCSSVGLLRTQPPSPSSPLLGRPAHSPQGRTCGWRCLPQAHVATRALGLRNERHSGGDVSTQAMPIPNSACGSTTRRAEVVPPPLRAARPPPTHKRVTQPPHPRPPRAWPPPPPCCSHRLRHLLSVSVVANGANAGTVSHIGAWAEAHHVDTSGHSSFTPAPLHSSHRTHCGDVWVHSTPTQPRCARRDEPPHSMQTKQSAICVEHACAAVRTRGWCGAQRTRKTLHPRGGRRSSCLSTTGKKQIHTVLPLTSPSAQGVNRAAARLQYAKPQHRVHAPASLTRQRRQSERRGHSTRTCGTRVAKGPKIAKKKSPA
jgi:hypothetical protein